MAAPLPITTAKNSFATLLKSLQKIHVIHNYNGTIFKVGSEVRTDYAQLRDDFTELLDNSNQVTEIIAFVLECLEPVLNKETNSPAPVATQALVPFSAKNNVA